MNTNCPQCGVDISQSSGVVCPSCDHVLKPDAVVPPLLDERRSRRRGPAMLVSFVVPFFLTLLCLAGGGAPLGMALVCGVVVGLLFLASWSSASRVTQSRGGQVIVGILFFVGGIAVVIGLLVGGCLFLMRGGLH